VFKLGGAMMILLLCGQRLLLAFDRTVNGQSIKAHKGAIKEVKEAQRRTKVTRTD
jgi:hypothetical protein